MLKTAKDSAPHLVHFILAGHFFLSLSRKGPHYSLSAIRGEYLSNDFNQNDNINCFTKWKTELSKWKAKLKLKSVINARRDETRHGRSLTFWTDDTGLTDSRRGPTEFGKRQLQFENHFPHLSMSGHGDRDIWS